MWLHGFSNFESTVYAMFFRIGWSLALSWTTFACAKGYGGPINSLLSWGPFTVLGRLTFFSYLIHLEIIPIILDSISWSFELNNFQVVRSIESRIKAKQINRVFLSISGHVLHWNFGNCSGHSLCHDLVLRDAFWRARKNCHVQNYGWGEEESSQKCKLKRQK